MLSKFVVLLLLASVATQLVHAQTSKPFSGRVFNAQSKRGVENLEVKLRPPRNSSAPIMIGTTDQNGTFRFAKVQIGMYLLEVSQGPYVLYRREVDLSKVDTVEIPLRRR